MHFTTTLFVAYGLLEAAAAFSLPFRLPWAHALASGEQAPLGLPLDEAAPPRIAIVGAGAAGSSAAFWISKAKERYGLDVEVDLFDSNEYIGGRSTTVHPYDDPELYPIELGASIFVEVNKNMWRATEEFGLNRSDWDEGEDTMGLWDGSKFVITTDGKLGGWWNTIKVIWRYGYQAPMKTKKLVSSMVADFVKLYTPEAGSEPFTNLTALATELNWTDAIGQSTMEYFDAQGIYPPWTAEMIEAATRVNYGQNVDAIHALEGMCSLAATGASQVFGGNWQIFEQFVKRSKAHLFLKTTVKSIAKDGDKYFLRAHTHGAAEMMERSYRAVIIAAPFHSSSIDLSLTSSAPEIPPQPYVHLHVTLLSTPSPRPRTRFFKVKDSDTVPTTVLTTWEAVRADPDAPAPDFNSLSYHGKILTRDGVPANSSDDGGEEWSVKIFSTQRLEDSWLRRAFGKIGWVYRKEWDAYPVLPPTTSFPPIKLEKGLYYVNAFEPFISTMETETIAARNVVELLMREEFDASICKSDGATPRADNDTFVYGWDC
ncbi:FAD/NAD(P)-binding domain-containing protein [Phanerochaete sordida]|uniref:FAD/NAD(P)-binding domain-containing protein n=1 Tax=Phanerochaete sordida TaxID=48140 RepID=A0A9P3GFU3_9APHY|nr:FAD/NAD(P)-binding domain-containing protein [Phanerochaete sordida]